MTEDDFALSFIAMPRCMIRPASDFGSSSSMKSATCMNFRGKICTFDHHDGIRAAGNAVPVMICAACPAASDFVGTRPAVMISMTSSRARPATKSAARTANPSTT